LILLGILWIAGMYVGLSQRKPEPIRVIVEYEHNPDLRVEIEKDGKLIPPLASELEGKRRPPGELSPETKRRNELMEIFNGRDPFGRMK
jgi:hypothetical protein